MNKKTIAIAALALIATSGLASAQALNAPKASQAQRIVVSSPLDAQARYVDTGSQFGHPGDNQMDRYKTNQY